MMARVWYWNYFYSFLGDSITFTCILQRKLNLSHSFFSCCDRWSWGKVCILVECQLLKLCHHTSQLGFHFLVAFKRSVWNKLIIINGTNAVTKITGYFLCNRHNVTSMRSTKLFMIFGLLHPRTMKKHLEKFKYFHLISVDD